MVSVFHPAVAFSDDATSPVMEFKWARTLKEQNVVKINICGNANIQVTKRSIAKDFLIGNPKTGYFFSELIAYKDYWKTLESHDLERAKGELTDRFKITVLWKVSDDGSVTRIGAPSKMEFPMTATVKDCMNGAKTTLGADCTKREDTLACCKEKFVGPVIYWKHSQDEFRLSYSPDPSITLKVPHERALRFCHAIDFITLK